MQIDDAAKILVQLLKRHGLHNTAIQFDRAKRRLGCFKWTTGRPEGIISLSRYFVTLNDEQRVCQTMLHEIAHALNWKRYGGTGHDARWKSIAIEIGAPPDRCFEDGTVAKPKGQFVGNCRDCGSELSMFRRPRATSIYRHNACRFKPGRGVIVWEWERERMVAEVTDGNA
jgi:predicted SprT family Zn-dependent metalloprotease